MSIEQGQDALFHEEGLRNEEREWWDQDPGIIVSPQLQEINGHIPQQHREIYINAQSQLLSQISGQFSRVYTEKPSTQSELDHIVVLNPVYPGLNGEMFASLQSKSGDEFTRACQNVLPETHRPMAISIGKKLTGKGLHPNFVNALIVDDNEFPINQLDFNQRITFFQSAMGKYGAFKNLFISINPKDPDNPISSAILATLEGGHPTFSPDHPERDFQELARRLRVFGSAKEAGGKIQQSEEKIDQGVWEQLDTVKYIQEMGRFAGENDLLSGPVKLRELVKSPILKRMIPLIANYSQQAEGAFYMFDPSVNLAIVTATGRFGAVKTDLKTDDLVPIGITPETLLRYGVTGLDIKEQSVEAQEFLYPQIQLAKEFDVRISKTNEGYEFSNSGERVPPIRATFHMHRSVDQNSNGAPILTPDIRIDPPVGCGVDVMEEISMKMMRQALEIWEQSDRKVPYVITEVPNHGLNVHFMWSQDANGNIHKNPFDVLREDIESGNLSFKREILQV